MIDRYGVVRVVEARIEDRHVAPFCVIRNDDGIACAVGQGQRRRSLPRVLSEALPHVGAENGVGAVAYFGVRVIKSKRGVGNGKTRAASAAVSEGELSVLVIGARGAGLHVNLVIVVLAGAFPQAAKLDRVSAFDPGKAVRDIVNGSGGVRRV